MFVSFTLGRWSAVKVKPRGTFTMFRLILYPIHTFRLPSTGWNTALQNASVLPCTRDPQRSPKFELNGIEFSFFLSFLFFFFLIIGLIVEVRYGILNLRFWCKNFSILFYLWNFLYSSLIYTVKKIRGTRTIFNIFIIKFKYV